MANDFSTDPSCKGHWRFEQDLLTQDEIGGNTLTNHGPVTNDLAKYVEGACSGDYTSGDYMDIADANLCSGFPFKSGDTTQNMTLCINFYVPSSGSNRWLIAKGWWLNQHSWGLDIHNNALYLIVTYNGSTRTDLIAGGSPYFTNGHWYFLTLIFDAANLSCQVVIYDRTAGSTVRDTTLKIASPIFSGSGPLTFGGMGGGGWIGSIDETVIFNRCINIEEMAAIRNGAYTGPIPYPDPGNDFSGDARFQAHWQFEPGQVIVDVLNANTLTFGNANYAFGVSLHGKQKLSCLRLDSGSTGGYAYVNDANLSANFPFKSGDTVQLMTVCCWVETRYWPSGAYLPWLWGKSTSYSGIGACIYTDGHLRIKCGNITLYDTGIVIPLYTRVHVAVVVDNKNHTLYVRFYDPSTGAVSTYSNNSIATIPNCTGPFCIGTSQLDSAIGRFNGYFDDFCVANALLNDSEIDSIRNQTFYTGVPLDQWQKVTQVIAQVEYDTLLVPRRVFPVPNPKTIWQTQGEKRQFPVVV